MHAKQSHAIDIDHIAGLAHLPITEEEKKVFLPQLIAILDFISTLQKIPTQRIEPTAQITGLSNIFREDVIDKRNMLTQQQALQNAASTYKGYIKVKAVLDEV